VSDVCYVAKQLLKLNNMAATANSILGVLIPSSSGAGPAAKTFVVEE